MNVTASVKSFVIRGVRFGRRRLEKHPAIAHRARRVFMRVPFVWNRLRAITTPPPSVQFSSFDLPANATVDEVLLKMPVPARKIYANLRSLIDAQHERRQP